MTITPRQLHEILRKHRLWLDGQGEGERADLSGAVLHGADLREANLRGAIIDYSAWPLWRGSLGVKVDRDIFAQLAYHLCRVVVEDEECKAAQRALAPIANAFQRVVSGELDKIEEEPT